MNDVNRQEARSLKGLATFLFLWALIPGALIFAVVRLFDELSKRDLLTLLIVVLVALVAAVAGGAITLLRNSRPGLRR
jgi:hypothetical protein